MAHDVLALRTLRTWLSGRLARPRRRIGRRLLSAVVVRRALATLLLIAAAALATQPASNASEPTVPTLVTSRDIPAGHELRPADLRIAQLPRGMLPDGALSTVDAAVGRVLAGAARAGEPVTDVRLAGRHRTSGDAATVPIRLADAGVASLLEPGMHVDVVTLGGESGRGRVLASRAVVEAVAGKSEERRSHDGRLVLLRLPADRANRVAAVSLNQPVTITLR